MNEDVRRLFAEYEELFDALDVTGQARLFADSFMSAGPHGAIAQTKAEFLKMAEQAAAFYKSVGQTSAKILSIEEIPISDEYSLVRVRWAATFQKPGTKTVEFDVSYVVQRVGGEPKIILFITHQDERQAMNELGLD
ncbi:MAG TPA: nuclear transport factor 2 family protein [Gemmatimonadales bacterium]|nr:nuclear transport factor 2 family protein [Gemmatimonadales bacterium]